MTLARREHRRRDDGAGMDRAAFECVVEILAMNRGAVDERRRGGGQRAGVPDRGARPIIVAGRDDAFDVVLVARSDREANHIDQKLPAFAPHRWRQLRRIKCGDFLREPFSDGGFRERAQCFV